jgi:hypothetical protein
MAVLFNGLVQRSISSWISCFLENKNVGLASKMFLRRLLPQLAFIPEGNS